jgi:hypothetical protein
MKTPVVLAVVMAGSVVFACSHPQKRTDWRTPPQTCASDDDCHGGKCAMPLGASQGTCSGGSSLPPLPPGQSDGGTHPPGPAPTIQPSSSDIQI